MRIEHITNPTSQKLEQIEAFVKSHSDANFFQSTFYYLICQNSPKIEAAYIVAFDQNVIIGILLVVKQYQIDLPFLRFLSSRNLIWGGPLVQNNNIAVVEQLFICYESVFSKVIYTQIRNLADTTYCKNLLQKKGFDYEPHLNLIIDLEQPMEELWKHIHSKRKNEIRRATKEGTLFEKKSDLESLSRCYHILKEVYGRAKLPLPHIQHFEEIFQKDRLKIFVAVYEEKIIGCMLCISYKDILFDYYAGAYTHFYNKYPNDLLPWEVVKWGKENGFKSFDFGGAGNPHIPYGVRDYKMKFGGKLVDNGRYEHIHYPHLFKLVKFGFKFYRNIIK